MLLNLISKWLHFCDYFDHSFVFVLFKMQLMSRFKYFNQSSIQSILKLLQFVKNRKLHFVFCKHFLIGCSRLTCSLSTCSANTLNVNQTFILLSSSQSFVQINIWQRYFSSSFLFSYRISKMASASDDEKVIIFLKVVSFEYEHKLTLDDYI